MLEISLPSLNSTILITETLTDDTIQMNKHFINIVQWSRSIISKIQHTRNLKQGYTHVISTFNFQFIINTLSQPDWLSLRYKKIPFVRKTRKNSNPFSPHYRSNQPCTFVY